MSQLCVRSEWRWSSLWRRRPGDEAARTTLARWPVHEPSDRLERVQATEAEAEPSAIRQAVVRGAPYGSERWTERTARSLGLEATLPPRGRPELVKLAVALFYFQQRCLSKKVSPIAALPERLANSMVAGVITTLMANEKLSTWIEDALPELKSFAKRPGEAHELLEMALLAVMDERWGVPRSPD